MASMPLLSLSTSPSAGPPATGSSCVFSLLGDDCLCTLLAAVDGAHALVKLDATCRFSRRAGDGAQSVTEEMAYGALLQLTYADTAAVIRKEKESWKSVLRPMQAITSTCRPLANYSRLTTAGGASWDWAQRCSTVCSLPLRCSPYSTRAASPLQPASPTPPSPLQMASSTRSALVASASSVREIARAAAAMGPLPRHASLQPLPGRMGGLNCVRVVHVLAGAVHTTVSTITGKLYTFGLGGH